MSVLTRSFKQTNGYFVVLGDLRGNGTTTAKVFVHTPVGGAGGDFKAGTFGVSPLIVNGGKVSTLLTTTGSLLKDMGKTVVSSNRTFRKVQVVIPGLSSSGVGELAPDSGYSTCYIELAGLGGLAGGEGGAAPVAYLPGLV